MRTVSWKYFICAEKWTEMGHMPSTTDRLNLTPNRKHAWGLCVPKAEQDIWKPMSRWEKACSFCTEWCSPSRLCGVSVWTHHTRLIGQSKELLLRNWTLPRDLDASDASVHWIVTSQQPIYLWLTNGQENKAFVTILYIFHLYTISINIYTLIYICTYIRIYIYV